MKNKLFLAGLLSLLLAAGLVLTGCPTDGGSSSSGGGGGSGGGGSGGGSSVNAKLVGTWKYNTNQNLIVEITAGAEFKCPSLGVEYDIEERDADTIVMFSSGAEQGTIDWAVSGTTLTLSNGTPTFAGFNGAYTKQ
ncbi:MAG: hypothetical protein LBP20_01765 [Treponema sp.]|nr:hypothetical protein [Treponema sp.]